MTSRLPFRLQAGEQRNGCRTRYSITARFESGDLALDSALELFEEGIQLSRFCHTKLGEAERRVEILLKNSSGHARAVPFESENEG